MSADNPLPDALEMLKLPTDKFLEAVSMTGVFVPKPWPHTLEWDHTGVYRCPRCRSTFTIAACYDSHRSKHLTTRGLSPCEVPPIITDSLADVAEALRKKATENGRYNLFKAVYHTMHNVAWSDMTSWWFDAPLQQRITCCLVALGLWRIGEKEKTDAI